MDQYGIYWCVDVDTGKKIKGTQMKVIPDCDSKDNYFTILKYKY